MTPRRSPASRLAPQLASALAALLALALAGCVSLPEGGAVRTVPGPEPSERGAGYFDFTPSGPRPGAPPLQVVEDWLLAMQAAPQSTTVARRFLTDEARAGWFPEKSTLVHGSKLVTGKGPRVHLGLQDTVRLDERGQWDGRVGGRDGLDYRLELVRERGEWRIANPPDALIIPLAHFQSRYRQHFVYFFDPTARVLVPEPTYLPHGDQAATILVRRLLRGPDPRLDGVLRSFIPGGTRYVLSVPVSRQGVAEVELSEQLLQLDGRDRQLALAQIGWTLRQVSGVESVRVTVAGAPVDILGSGSPRSVDSWTEYDPAVDWATPELFGLRSGRAVALDPEDGAVTGRFAASRSGLRDLSVDLAGEEAVGVTEDGTTVVSLPRGSTPDRAPGPDAAEVVADGEDWARPAWDLFGGLWLLDRTDDGARVLLRDEGRLVPVSAPGIAGAHISDFVVSRDGSRLVAVVRGRSGDHLVLARVLRGAGGKVQGLTAARPLPLAEQGVDEILDLAWRTPGSLAVLTAPTPETAQVQLALVDGSTPAAAVDSTAETLEEPAVHLAAEPSSASRLTLADAEGDIFEIGVDGQWTEVGLDPPLHAPTYAG